MNSLLQFAIFAYLMIAVQYAAILIVISYREHILLAQREGMTLRVKWWRLPFIALSWPLMLAWVFWRYRRSYMRRYQYFWDLHEQGILREVQETLEKLPPSPSVLAAIIKMREIIDALETLDKRKRDNKKFWSNRWTDYQEIQRTIQSHSSSTFSF